MAIMNFAKRSGRGLAVAAALVASVAFTAAPGTAYAQHRGGGGGIGPGAAVGLGLGALALGTAIGAGAYYNPYYAPGYYPPAAYYPPAPYYPAPRSCWDPYYRHYYAC